MLHLSSYYLIVYLGVRLVYYFEHVVITCYARYQRVILGEPCVSIIRKMLTTVSQPIRIVVQDFKSHEIISEGVNPRKSN